MEDASNPMCPCSPSGGRRGESSREKIHSKHQDMKGSKKAWLFRVEVPELEKYEFVYVVGNVPELGSWNHNQAIQLHQEHTHDLSNATPTDKDELFHGGDNTKISNNSFDDEDAGSRTFCTRISLPTDADIEFRYFIAVVCYSNGTKNCANTLIIRKWETHMTPRIMRKDALRNASDESIVHEPDKFGYHNGYCKIERGWLTDETVIQFKLFNNPIKIWKNRLQNRKIFIKMTPVNLVRHNSLEISPFTGDCVDDSLSMDTQDIVDQPAISVTEISVMNDEEAIFKYQKQFGRLYEEDEFIIFSVAVRYPETIILINGEMRDAVRSWTELDNDGVDFRNKLQHWVTIDDAVLRSEAYLVDYYAYGSRCYPGDAPPTHIGFSYILPSTLQASVGLLTIPITSTKHRPIGQLTVEYVTIKPIPDYPWDMSISYAKHWEQRWSGLDVGHRGLGTSFKCEMKNCANVRENTIASLKTASHHGADMVEFDVQLSKDMIPVIYHDFYVSISLKRKKQIDAMDMLEIPVKDLTLEQLHLLKDYYYPLDSMGKVLHFTDSNEQANMKMVYHLAEGREKNPRFFDEDLEDHQPFPTLKDALQQLEPHVGCNVEIKWTMQLKDGTFELNHPFDLNMYLDIILKVVLEYGGDRKIVFSSFNPDICTMIRLKQNKYPVVFLTQGVTIKYPTYHDPRCQTIPMAMRHALAADILGINVHTEDILRDSSQVKIVKDRGLIIFCWGDDNNDKATIQHLKKLGLHAVIYDKMDEYNPKEVKESIFLVDARESQKALLAVAHCNQTCGPPPPPIPEPITIAKDYALDLENTRKLRTSTSTATTLASLAHDSVGGDSLFPTPNKKILTNFDSEDAEMGDLTKGFSECANNFGHTLKSHDGGEISCNESKSSLELMKDDESAIDCP